MSVIKYLWQQYATAAIVGLALIGGLIWGINLGRAMEATHPTPTATSSVNAAAEHVNRITPGKKVQMELDAPPPGMAPPAEPRLRMRLDIRDDFTEQPVRAEVWLVAGDKEKFVAGDVSLIEFSMPGTEGTATIRVQAPGYQLWTLTFNYKTKYDRLMPLPVRLEPEPVQTNGA